LKIQALLD